MKDILEKIYNEEENIFYSILEDLLTTNKKKFIITVNPEIIMKSYKNIEIKEMLLNDNNILVPDGISIIKKANIVLIVSYLLIIQSIICCKNQKHINQFTMSLLFCVILFYMIFLPLYLPLSEFVNTDGTI